MIAYCTTTVNIFIILDILLYGLCGLDSVLLLCVVMLLIISIQSWSEC